MKAREITQNVHWLGAVDWDRRLFDSLIPLPDGTSYNAYLIEGSQKTALLDTVDPAMADVLLGQLQEVSSVDYLISQHAEQDHSGTLSLVLDRFPQAKVVCTPKAKGLLMDLLKLPAACFLTVEDQEEISLGDKNLRFIHTPWVHWPETMVTYLQEDKILFSCDFLGAHIASSELFVSDQGRVYEAAKRYFAEIMMPFRSQIAKNLDKLKDLEISTIAPSHGQIYPEPSFILKAYEDWVHSAPGNSVVLPYVSMHGSTRIMVEHLVSALVQRGVQVEQFDLTVTDIGKLAIALVDAGSIVLGTPTIHAGPHPHAAYAALLANTLRPKAQFVSIIGSYGWGGKTVDTLAGMISKLKVEVLEPVLCKGLPQEQDLKSLDNLADAIAAKHKEQGFV